MPEDIRDRLYLNHQDVVRLNFIRNPGKYHYRRHYRAGLRSHIMEVLNSGDLKDETKGIITDGLTWYPRAEPQKMLRIFRIRFKSLAEAEEEVERVKIIQIYLAPDYLANTEEFLVDYISQGKREILLCGLQEYVQGEVVEPWNYLGRDHLISLLYRMGLKKGKDSVRAANQWIQTVRKKTEDFIRRIKRMILEANHIPDLAGAGNLLLTRSGHIKLVDINNISAVSFDPIIHVDDKGYPVCDKSIEALYLLEQKLLEKSAHPEDHIYKTFLDPERMNTVKKLQDKFHRSMNPP
jgi:hypothetical protein